MKRLFVISNDNEMDLNKEWLHLVPEFARVLHRRWFCEGDADGRKKIMARRIFGYIYLMVDYASPLFTWEEDARRAEAMKMMQLTAADLDTDGVQDAYDKYQELVQESSVILKSLKSVYSTIHKMQEYMDSIDFTKEDKQGKLQWTPAQAVKTIKDMNSMYDAVQQLERRVMEDLKKEANTIRGTATLGGREGKRKKEWTEASSSVDAAVKDTINEAIENDQTIVATDREPDFRDIGGMLRELTKDQEDD